jgi:hypothetical protein
MRRAHAILLASSILASALEAAPRSGNEGNPVSASMLDGATLKFQGGTITAPSSLWKWTRTSFPVSLGTSTVNADAFICQNGVDDRDLPYMFVVATGEREQTLDAAKVDSFVRGLKRGAGNTSFIFARAQTEASSVPWDGSWRFRYEILDQHVTAYMFGYVAMKGATLYVTQCIRLDAQEPQAFTDFSASIRPVAAAPKNRSRRAVSTAASAGGAAAVIFAIVAARRKKAAVPVTPPARRPFPPRR